MAVYIYIILSLLIKLQNIGLQGDFHSRGLTEENNRMGIIFSIGHFKSPIVDILCSWGLGICSLTLLYLTQNPQFTIGYIIPNCGFDIHNWGEYTQLGIFSFSCLVCNIHIEIV